MKNLCKTYIVLAVFTFLKLTLYGQNIELHGCVRDSLSSKAIEYANVLLLSKDSTYINGTTTDSLGVFRFTVKADINYFVKVTHINYQSKLLTIRSKQFENNLIELLPYTNVLEEISVIGSADILKITSSNLIYKVPIALKETAFLTTDILSSIPNVFVDFNNNIFVNGDNKVLVLQNGIELPNNGLTNQISPKSIEKIEISRIVPTKYLNKGYSTIINIITKRYDKTFFRLSGNISTGRMYDADVNYNTDYKGHSFYSYYKLYYRNFESRRRASYSILDNKQQYELYTFPRKEFDNEFFSGYSYTINQKIKMGIDAYCSLYNELFKTKDTNNANNSIDLSSSKINFITQVYAPYYYFKDSTRNLTARINVNLKSITQELSFLSETNNSNAEKNRKISMDLDYNKNFSNTFTLEAGINYNNINNLTNTTLNQHRFNSHYVENNISYYVGCSKNINNLSLVAGISFVNYNRHFVDRDIKINTFFTLPKASIQYAINENSNLALDFYSSHSTPSIWQMISIPIKVTSNLALQGNPYLRPERINKLSFEYSHSKKNDYFSLQLYYKSLNNKIVDSVQISNNTLMTNKMNLKDIERFGLASSFNSKLFSWFTLRLYVELFNSYISQNCFFQKSMISYQGNITGILPFNEKLFLAIKYQYLSPTLTYEGYYKSQNNSLCQLKYNLNKKISLSFIAVQPFGIFESKSKIFYANNSFLENTENINVRTLLFSFTYNIVSNSKQKQNLYYNEDKKY